MTAGFFPDAGADRFAGPFLAVALLVFSSVASSSSDNLSSSFIGVSSFSIDAACFFDEPGPLAFRLVAVVVVFFLVSISSFCSEI